VAFESTLTTIGSAMFDTALMAMLMRYYLPVFCIIAGLLLAGCNEEPRVGGALPAEQASAASEVEEAGETGMAKPIVVDLKKNPFVAEVDTGQVKACGDTARAAVFRCVVGQFRTAPFPIEVGPGQEPASPFFFDSLFVLKCLHDTAYFQEGPADRTYGYHKGRVLARTPRYVLCLIPFGFSVGYDYRLFSFTPEGRLLDTRSFGGQGADVTEMYGTMPDARHFSTRYVELGEDGKVVKQTIRQFVVSEDGRFERK